MTQDQTGQTGSSSQQETADLIQQLRQSEATLAQLLNPDTPA
jgi:hypothetical protein